MKEFIFLFTYLNFANTFLSTVNQIYLIVVYLTAIRIIASKHNEYIKIQHKTNVNRNENCHIDFLLHIKLKFPCDDPS